VSFGSPLPLQNGLPIFPPDRRAEFIENPLSIGKGVEKRFKKTKKTANRSSFGDQFRLLESN
jgi:hypothetical protein